MTKKAMTFLTGTIVAVIIVALVIVVYVVFFARASAISTDPIIAQCQQSAALAGVIRTPGVDKQIIDFNCPVSQATITQSSISGNVDAQTLKASGDATAQKYNLEKAMWNQINNCYQKVDYGVFPLFDRNWIANGQTYCVVCSVVSFDPSVKQTFQKTWLDSSYMMNSQQILGYSKTIPQILADRKDTAATTQSTIFNVRVNQAVVYYRTELSSYDRVFAKYLDNIQAIQAVGSANAQIDQLPSSISWLRYIPGTTVGVLIGNSLWGTQAPSAPAAQDVDGIMILNYDSTQRNALNSVCDIIGNEKYVTPGST